MQINAPEVKKTLSDYDFLFSSGVMLPITIDTVAGDTIDFGSDVISVNLAPRPSQVDPRQTIPAEEIIIYIRHLLSVQKRKREITELSPEQKVEWREAFNKPISTVQ